MSILVLTSDTLVGTPATGNLEYNGQFFGTDSNASRAQLQRIVRATAVASTSGTSIDFTGIPAWVEKITVMFSLVSTNGTSNVQIQLGDSGGIENTGYTSCAQTDAGSSGVLTSGFAVVYGVSAAGTISGSIQISSITGNTWVAFGVVGNNGGNVSAMYGNKSLSDVLTQIRITTINGTDAFDAGTINIIYEG
jgi:hypothetical protein